MKEKTKKLKKLLAFTLAEVLITLSILGVVAAITVPSLIKRQHRNEVETKIAKTVSALHDALSRAEIESGKSYVAKISEFKANRDVVDYVSPYLNVAKNCTRTTKDCITYKLVSRATGQESDNTFSGIFKPNDSDGGYIVLKDGTYIKINNASKFNYLYFNIDINGPQKPNMGGSDIFAFRVYPDSKTGSFIFPYNTYDRSISSNVSQCIYNQGIASYSGDTNAYCGLAIYLNHFKVPKDYPYL